MSRVRKHPARSRLAESELFPIRTVSNLTGVNAITLRAWERRYGLVTPVRTDGGQRLYRRKEIELIQRIVALLDKGMPISQVARSVAAAKPAGNKGSSSPWPGYLEQLLSAIRRFDEDEVEAVYNAALASHSIAVVTDRLLVPLLHELGHRWETGEGSVAQEHFFSAYMRNKLGARIHHRSRASTGPKLLVACFPGEQHELGLLLFSLLAADRGMRVVMLAANLPLDEHPAAARSSRCDAIVLSATMAPDRDVLAAQLPAMVKAAKVPVFVGGVASIRDRDAIVAGSAQPVGTDFHGAMRLIEAGLVDTAAA
jgi:MerR family transcriptional regulator, light-induced transcriptional regulator